MLYFGDREIGGKKGRCEYHPTRERRDAEVIFTRAQVSLALLSLRDSRSRSLFTLSLVKFYPLDLSLQCMRSGMFIQPFFNYGGLYGNIIYLV